MNTISKGPPLQGLGFNNLKSSFIQLVKVSHTTTFSILKTWKMTNADSVAFNANGGVMQWNDTATITYDPDTTVRYFLSTTLVDSIGAQNTDVKNASVQAHCEFYDTTGANVNTSFQGGMRISAIVNYDMAGSLINRKSYRYVNADSSSSGLLMSSPKYWYSKNMWFGTVFPEMLSCDEAEQVLPINFMSSESAIPYSNAAGGNIVGYSRVEEIELGPNGTTNGKHIYNYNNNLSNTKLNNPDDPNLLNGMVKSEVILSASGDSLMSTAYSYIDNIPSLLTFSGIKIFSNDVGLDICDPTFSPVELDKFEIDFYPITSHWYLPGSKKTKYYSNGRVLSSTENYSYNSIGQLVETDKLNSKSQRESTKLVYPADTATSQSALLIDSGYYNNLIEQKQMLSDSEVSRTDLVYGIENGQLVQTSLKRSIHKAPAFTDVNFDQYGLNKRINQFTQKSFTSSLIWDYRNNYVVAEIKNAGITDVAYTSFEADGSGNWAIGSSSRDTTAGVTGKNSYVLGSDISKSGLNSAQTYVVSYWTQNSSAFSITGTISGYPVKGKTINGWTLYIHRVTGQTSITINGTGHIDELRLYPLGAQMTSYTFTPLAGMTSQCDVANRVTYYEYDGILRLQRIRDQDHNILKTLDYQYQATNNCGPNCFIEPMQTLAGTNTLGYPVGVFNVHGQLLGNAVGPGTFVSLWNTDTADSHTGTLAAGADSLHFTITLNTGKTLPQITGCRYYQVDLHWTQLDAIRNFNAAYVDFGDGTGMHMGLNLPDTLTVLAPGTSQSQAPAPGFNQFAEYFVHNYPDTTLKTITFYHNDGAQTGDLDNLNSPAASLARVKNLRGNLPQNTNLFGGSSYQQPTMLSIANVSNWGSIHTITNFNLNTGDEGITMCENLNYAQDFMAANKKLDTVQLQRNSLACYFDSTFKISRFKSDWNTYFTNLRFLSISDAQWNKEDLSALINLNFFDIIPGRPLYSNSATGNAYISINSTEIDNIINQIAAGAGRTVSNGIISIVTGGANRTSNSDAALRVLTGKGWQVNIDTTSR
jgi:hypothetical protein